MNIWRKKKGGEKEEEKKEEKSIFEALYSLIVQIPDDVASLYSKATGKVVNGETFRARIYGCLLKLRIPVHIGGPMLPLLAITSEEAEAIGFYEGLRNPSLATMLAYGTEVPYEKGHKLGRNLHKTLENSDHSACHELLFLH